MFILASVNPFTFFSKSDLFGQIVFVVLCALSLVAWTTMIGKFLQLKRLRTANTNFSGALAKSPSVTQAPTTAFENVDCPYAKMTANANAALSRAQSMEVDMSSQMGHVENAIQRTLNSSSLTYENRMILLGSIVSGAPFLGLLGTVWGVMVAFGGIAMQNGPATIQSLAPGVAAALLTTAAGLLVAIPAVFGYNYLLTRTKIMVNELENFSSALADRIELENFAENEGHTPLMDEQMKQQHSHLDSVGQPTPTSYQS